MGSTSMEEPKTVLRVIVEHMIYPVTIDVLKQVSSIGRNNLIYSNSLLISFQKKIAKKNLDYKYFLKLSTFPKFVHKVKVFKRREAKKKEIDTIFLKN